MKLPSGAYTPDGHVHNMALQSFARYLYVLTQGKVQNNIQQRHSGKETIPVFFPRRPSDNVSFKGCSEYCTYALTRFKPWVQRPSTLWEIQMSLLQRFLLGSGQVF